MKKTFIYLIITVSFSLFGQDSENKDINIYVSSLIKTASDNNEINGTKALSYIEKALEYENSIRDSTRSQLYQVAGNTYFWQESYYLALKYYNKRLEIENNHNSIKKYLTYNNIGGVYWRLNDKEKAKEYWEKCLEGLKKSKEIEKNYEKFAIYNNLAISERAEGNYIKSLELLNEHIKYSIKDTTEVVKAYQNVSINYVDLKEYDTAFVYLNKAKNMAKKANLKSDLSLIYSNLGSFYTEFRVDRDSAKYYSLEAFNLSNQYQFPFVKRKSAETLVVLYKEEHDYKQAYHYLNIAKLLSEEMIKDENVKKINQIEHEHEQKIKEQDLQLKQKKKETIYIVFGIILSLTSVIMILVYRLQKNSLKRRTVENKLLASELEDKNKELAENAIQMLQTNEMIDTTHKELAELKGVVNLPAKKMLSKIIVDLKSGPKGFNKEEFEKLFKETHEDFYKKLLKKYPDLTRNEIRLCAFAKMNLSTKEISAITQQSHNSIVTARYRLRKKLGLEEWENLTNFLIQL